MDPKFQPALAVLNQYTSPAFVSRINAKDPAAISKAKRVLEMIKGLQAGPMPPEINIKVIQFLDNVGARPEVAGIRTQIQGNRWEEKHPLPLPFKRSK